MNKLFATATLMLFANVSHADIIKCNFTEPFITTTYSTTQSTLKIESLGESTKVLKNVSFQIIGAGIFNLVDSKGHVVQKLTLNNNGSDGMSDTIYPYEVQDFDMSGANNGIGGCSSNYLKSEQH